MRPARKARAALGSVVFLAAAPGVVAGFVPWLLTRWNFRDPLPDWIAFRIVGAIVLVAGVGVLLHAFARFVVEGVGTPAPVVPTERLVVGGLYRYVRNPMYIAVAATIVGQALLLGQLVLVPYAVAFVLVVVAFVHWYEEPHLLRQFGAEYDVYRRAVPGWRPRRHPWEPGAAARP